MESFKTYFLLERQRPLPLVCIDIQPSYDSFSKKIMSPFVSFVNNHRGPIICFFNGEEVGVEDTSQSVAEYYLENGMDEEKVDSIQWREKGYAFFRNWMDQGMERNNLIKAIRYMVMNRLSDSRDVSLEDWEKVFGDSWEEVSSIVEGDSIYIPSVSLSELKSLGGCYLCGGHRDECLSEFRLLLETFNIPYKLISSLVYY